jgi:hypothetical protein
MVACATLNTELYWLMRNTLISHVSYWLLCAAGCLICLTTAHANNREMQQRYQALQPALEHNTFGIPVTIQSSDAKHTMHGEVYGVMAQPFQAVQAALISPPAWCDIVSLHLNIKACTNQRVDTHCQLTFYSGRKFYEKAEDVYQLIYRFTVNQTAADYFHTTLSAEDGPMGTSHYRIEVEAIPLAADKTFLHFSYTYHYNFLTSLGMNTYLATLGSGKVGFSVSGTDAEGKPVYVSGIRGVMERNTIRYYFAIESYLDTLHLEPAQRFTARITKWFELTERFPKQLHELDKKDYLEYKQRERTDQLHLQHRIQQSCATPASLP